MAWGVVTHREFSFSRAASPEGSQLLNVCAQSTNGLLLIEVPSDKESFHHHFSYPERRQGALNGKIKTRVVLNSRKTDSERRRVGKANIEW